MSKNIVIFSDGTGQLGGEGANTNIYKLFNIIEDRTPSQISFYDPGIGSIRRSPIALGSGLGFSKNIIDCYNFIFENYQAGDNIYLFGFSRGAATVRSLSGFIHLFGILPSSRKDLVNQAYKIYKTSNIERRREKAYEFINKHHTMWTKIEFLGVFDTVAALGVGAKLINKFLNWTDCFKHNYHDFSLSQSVVHACHALSIDEERKAFNPVLWEPKILSGQTLKQVWFPGVHTDVGGGYNESGLSDSAYEWMLKEAKDKGLRIYDESRIQISPDPDGFMHEEKYIFWKLPYSRKQRSWPFGASDKLAVHRSTLKRTKGRYNQATPYKPWVTDCPHDIEG